MGDATRANDKVIKTERIFAEICVVYVEILAGIRRPEQLARWLTDKGYYEMCQKTKQEAIARQITGARERPDIQLIRSRVFLSNVGSIQGVVILRISGKPKAVSIRAEKFYERFRITDLALVSSS